MPFKSKAQRDKLIKLVKDGKMSQETFDKIDKETTGVDLPDKVKPKWKGLLATVKRPRRVLK